MILLSVFGKWHEEEYTLTIITACNSNIYITYLHTSDKGKALSCIHTHSCTFTQNAFHWLKHNTGIEWCGRRNIITTKGRQNIIYSGGLYIVCMCACVKMYIDYYSITNEKLYYVRIRTYIHPFSIVYWSTTPIQCFWWAV